MKKLIRLFLILAVIIFFSQEISGQINDTIKTKSHVNNDVEEFLPNTKLLNKSIWHRVTANRFECEYLRLAVELRNKEYWLLEMDGKKRLLARHEKYSIISHVISKLTLRSPPYLIEKMK